MMDPHTTLMNAVIALQRYRNTNFPDRVRVLAAADLADAFEALDTHLSQGGILPTRWDRAHVQRYRVALVDYGPRKIDCIKEVRALLLIGLREAKQIVDGVSLYFPYMLYQGDEGQCQEIGVKFESVGATVKITLEEAESC